METPCQKQPCQNGATCVRNAKSSKWERKYTCICPEWYKGKNCERKYHATIYQWGQMNTTDFLSIVDWLVLIIAGYCSGHK